VGADEVALIRSGLALAFAFAAVQAFAQSYPLEIISLRHRTVDQVLPSLRPLLDPGATLSGQSGQLFVRTSPENLVEIRRALDAIDTPTRRLRILVRFDDAGASASRDVSASAVITNRGSAAEVRAREAQSTSNERIDQQVQVVEGGTAWIGTGVSRSLPERRTIPGTGQQTYVIQEATTGFAVQPRLAGNTVHLDIAPQREALGPRGSMQSQRISTSASGRLGAWFAIGGVVAASARNDRGIATSGRTTSSDSQRIWVKVEEVQTGERRP
jgi:hypothetical protein